MLHVFSVKLLFLVLGFMPLASDTFETKDSEFKIIGTSTLHDWEMVSRNTKGKAILKITGNVLEKVEALSFSIPALSLKSGKKAMDSNALKALKASENPNILFNFISLTQLSQKDGKMHLLANGLLNIAGESRNISLNVTAEVVNQEVIFMGSHKMKMTDYNMVPPTFMGGVVKTGDEVLITFNLKFSKNN
jgi:polyisoprenoid-binding protein YceI